MSLLPLPPSLSFFFIPFPESSGKRKYMAGKRGVEKLSPKTFVFFGSCHTNYQLFQILDVCRSMSFHEASIQVA